MSFLGLINYYRKFVPECSRIAAILYDKNKQNTKFTCHHEHEKAFLSLKGRLKNTVSLIQPDYNKEFILDTNACLSGIAAILSQKHLGIKYPSSFASKRLTPAEVKYSISEKECLLPYGI